MCGIAGAFLRDDSRHDPRTVASAVRRMADAMVRRGPDDAGFWSSPDARAAFGFRRLAILDLSPAGHQPMVSGDGKSAIVFNGEIYNFAELRRELEAEGMRFRSRSDTEVLLEALHRWGRAALPRLNGMFALAWYDLRERKLLLARDHAGIKPLYYTVSPHGDVGFASEYDGLVELPWVDRDAVRLDVLRLYLELSYIPAPYGLLRGTHQLPAGHWLEVDAHGRVTSDAWWRLRDDTLPDLSGGEAVEAVTAALASAVARQRVADVPVGVFLSGGVDSPLVAGAARDVMGPGVHAFTIGNPGWRQDESEDATRFGKLLDVQHHLWSLDGKQAADHVGEVADAQYEPFADFSVLPTLLVSQLARKNVTVALSGDGGDELFFGYERPTSLLRAWQAWWVPYRMRRVAYLANRVLGGPKMPASVFSPSPTEYYRGVNSRFRRADIDRIAPAIGGSPADFGLFAFDGPLTFDGLAGFSRRAELGGQLQRCLKKVDMASMFHSLEVRVPMLDREVIDVSLRISPRAMMAGGRRKAVLFEALERRVPPQAVSRQKRGFAVPLAGWLRNELRPLAEDTLRGGSLWPGGLFEPRQVESFLAGHVAGQHDRKWPLWTLMCLQWWRTRLDRRRAAHGAEAA